MLTCPQKYGVDTRGMALRGQTNVVVHYVDSNTFGGVEQVVLTLLSSVDRRRWHPVLYVHDSPGISRLLSAAHDLSIDCRLVPLPRTMLDIRRWRSFRDQLKIDRPAVFHAHLSWPLGCRHGIMAAKLARLPYVVATAHLYFPIRGVSFHRLKQQIQAAAIDRYIAVSEEVARRLCIDLRVPRDRVLVVQNGIDTATQSTPGTGLFRTALLGGQYKNIVFTAARLHVQKGVDILLQAAAKVPDALFLVAGDGPERERLQALIEQLSLGDRFRLLGHRTDITALLAACDVFVLPSLYEGLPLSVLEAMSAGKPVIATATGGTDEAVIDGVSGMLVPPRDVDRLAAAISELLQDSDLSARLAAQGQLRVRQHFSAESMARKTENVYLGDLEPGTG